MRKNELEFLEKIEESTQMGMHSIANLLPIVKDESLKATINEQYEDYRVIGDECNKLKMENGEQPKQQGSLKKMMSSAEIKMSTLIDKSPSHIAEMMISGSTMGINLITKELNEKSDCVDNKIKELADKLLHIEQRNIDTMRNYL